jgi:hypothetical protein
MEVSVGFMTPPLYARGNRPLYPEDRRLDEPQSRCGNCEEQRYLTLDSIILGVSFQFPESYFQPFMLINSYTIHAIYAELIIVLTNIYHQL